MKKSRALPLVNRELSWLYFNARVLQEAENPAVPLYERLNFLAIFSSNLDEFFSVRVAALRSLLRLNDPAKGLDEDPQAVLAAIQRTVTELQQRFGAVLRESILPAAATLGRPLARETELTDDERALLRSQFEAQIRPHLHPVVLDAPTAPHLAHHQIYLACVLSPAAGGERAVGVVALPSAAVGRFVTLDGPDGSRVLFLDDVVRAFLPALFPEFEVGPAFSFKVSRDSELYLGDCRDEAMKEEFSKQLRKRLRKSLEKRGSGLPTRFLYDPEMPEPLLRTLCDHFGLADEDLVPGGRYHHLRDLRTYPRPDGNPAPLDFPPQPPHPHPALSHAASLFDAIGARDHLLCFPYQSFDPVVRWVQEAARDPHTERIAVTIYRAAEQSALAAALEEAARGGKRVEVVVELKARFDEAQNLDVAESLEQAGARVFYTPCDLKVHAKLVLVERRDPDTRAVRRYAYLSTGNLNEQTARFYTDFGLLTADPRLTDDAARVFDEMTNEAEPGYDHLLVAPRGLRRGLYRLIDAETDRARSGEPAWLFFKVNALEDPKLIGRLYEAAQAGVKIRLLVRGICRLVAGLPGVSDNIEVRSIVGRYLEHGRAFVFGNGGHPLVYLGSADLMRRNLSRRIEVVFPVLDTDLAHEVASYLELQWADTHKARQVDGTGANLFVHPAPGAQPVSAQDALYARYGGVQETRMHPPIPSRDQPTERTVVIPSRPPMKSTAETPAAAPGRWSRLARWAEIRPFWSSLVLLGLLLSFIPILLMCNQSGQEIRPSGQVAGIDTARASYLPMRPDTVLTLDGTLEEISGHALLGDSLLAAVQDERGTLYFLDPRDGHIVREHNFAGDGDFEEVELTPEGLVVLESNGDLYFIADWSGERSDVAPFETTLPRKCDAEGMTFDADANRLLLSCKENPGDGLGDVRAIYAFDLAGRTLSAEPIYQLDLAAVSTMLRDGSPDDVTSAIADALRLNEFKPSAIALHPLNGQLYVVSTVPPSVAVLSAAGELLGAELLPDDILPQPEGIAFFANGDMLLSSEAAETGQARFVRYRYLKR